MVYLCPYAWRLLLPLFSLRATFLPFLTPLRRRFFRLKEFPAPLKYIFSNAGYVPAERKSKSNKCSKTCKRFSWDLSVIVMKDSALLSSPSNGQKPSGLWRRAPRLPPQALLDGIVTLVGTTPSGLPTQSSSTEPTLIVLSPGSVGPD